jgi:DNA-binding NarL/FixJ family response regulator
MQTDTITVLLVDDDEGFYTILKHILKKFQNKTFEIIWEAKGGNVIERLRQSPQVQIILMDYYLPNTTGLELTKQLYDAKLEIPIIFLTSNKDFRTAVEAIKFGAEDYLLKEDATDTVIPRTILSVLERVRLKRQISEAEKNKRLSQSKTDAIQELVVTICHEFNNPLAAIKMSASILSRQTIPTEDKQLIDRIIQDATFLEKQINTLRDLNFEKLP